MSPDPAACKDIARRSNVRGVHALWQSPWIELSKYIGAGQTVLFKHTFATDIEPQDANLEVLFDYDDIEESEEYRVLALNVPVKIIYNDSLFDAYSIMLYIWGTTLTGLVGYIFYLVFFSAEKPKPAKTKKPRAPVEPKEPVPPSTEPDMSWIPDHVVQGHKKAGSPKLKKRK
nr:hypothetical protein HK105_002717 [Polyrhizophydium stewartii]